MENTLYVVVVCCISDQAQESASERRTSNRRSKEPATIIKSIALPMELDIRLVDNVVELVA